MGLDITISRVQEIKCPDCGKVVAKQSTGCVDSCGRIWHEFLDLLGYDSDKWYGEDMELSEDQSKALVRFANENNLYCKEHIESLIAIGMLRGEKIVINANW